jgi:hypothetical protein
MGAHMDDRRPGLSIPRLGRLVDEAVARCKLDLRDVTVLTEAATGPYVVTPVIAAVAGAAVTAVTRETPYGTVRDVTQVTLDLAEECGVADRICVTDERSPRLFAAADVVTNSGHLRPIVGACADAIRPDAVLTLMFETWEIDAGRLDVDLESLRARGVAIGGTNERHPDVDVFSYLGPMAVVQLADAGVAARGGRVAILCDNPFGAYLWAGLLVAGAEVVTFTDPDELLTEGPLFGELPDAVLVALAPTGGSVLPDHVITEIGRRWPGCVVVQFWGDVDREMCATAGVATWPPTPPPAGHMGVLPSRVGPEPIVRLQAGGLKVAQVLLTPPGERSPTDEEYLDAG